jgi:solute carrier family 6 amino acid transporter-like protein 5/7/9/14
MAPLSVGMDDGLGPLDWRLVGCIGLAWAVIFLTLARGLKSSGKVAYFTALFPYVVLITFLVKGLTLDGALKGITYFVKPQWHRLAEPDVSYGTFSLG